MSGKEVLVLPSGRRFAVQVGESVLEAALRSGLAVRYCCSNGTCGECKARLVQGRYELNGPQEYVLKNVEKSAGTFLMCRASPLSDLVIEATEAHSPTDIPRQKITATVGKIERWRDEVALVSLRTPRSKTLRFLSGQYVRLRIADLPPRSKSIASCPCNGMILQFHVRRRPGDVFAEYVFEHLRPRQSVLLQGPYGDFVMDEEARRPMLFIAYGTGFAPVKSLVEHAIALEMSQSIQLYWVADSDHGHYLANYCRSWQDALDDFHFAPLLPADYARHAATLADLGMLRVSEPREAFALAAAQIISDHADLSAFDIYINGPGDSVEPAVQLLQRHGLLKERLFVDTPRRF